MNKLFTQMRNEWRSNIWLALELLIVSVVMWVCVSSLTNKAIIMAEPRGHDISHVYRVYIGDTQDDDGRSRSELLAELIERVRRRPEVEYAAYSNSSIPYTGSMRSVSLVPEDSVNAPVVNYGGIHRWVQPDFFNVFRIKGVRGESSEQLAQMLRPGTNVFAITENGLMDSIGNVINAVDQIGHKFTINGYPNHSLAAVTEKMKRFDDEPVTNNQWAASGLFDMMSDPALPFANELSVRVRANMDDGSFIENFMNDSESQLRVGPYYVMNVESFSDIRANAQLELTSGMRNFAIGVGFLLFNIFLGLLGSFWFRTQQRISEIAIHKVHGATSGMVFARLITEGLLLLLIVLPIAVIIGWGLLHYNFVDDYGTSFNIAMAGVTLALMALMIVGGVFFPARRAMSVVAATALHDD